MNTLTHISRTEKLLRIVGLCVVCVCAAVYVLCVNTSSTKGYTLHATQTEISALELQTARLHAEVTRLRSLSSVRLRQQFTHLSPPSQVEYVRLVGENVAYR